MIAFAAVSRYRWLRELRARWPWAAALLVLAVAGQLALTSPRQSLPLAELGPIVVVPGQTLTLENPVAPGSLLGLTAAVAIDVRADEASLAAETAALLGAAGAPVAPASGPASWITRADADVGSERGARVELAAADPGRPPSSLVLRILPGATERQVRLAISAVAGALQVSMSVPWTGEAHAPRKVLRIAGQDVALSAGIPSKLVVPAGRAVQLALVLPAGEGAVASADLGVFDDRGGGLAVASLRVADANGVPSLDACSAPAGGWLWRAKARLAVGDCPGGQHIFLRRLDLAASGASLTATGNAWVARGGVLLGDDLLDRLRRQPLAWSLLLLVDALLVTWALLALLPGPRRIALKGVFISYRRADSGPWVGRLHDRLVARLGAERVFLDAESIPAGVDFAAFIDASLARVDAVLAVIGPAWSEMRDDAGRRRVETEEDFVRREIARALAAGLRVVPVLVGGAAMPAAARLPSDLAAFARCNAVPIGDRKFLNDVDDLIDQLEVPSVVSRETGAAPAATGG